MWKLLAAFCGSRTIALTITLNLSLTQTLTTTGDNFSLGQLLEHHFLQMQ